MSIPQGEEREKGAVSVFKEIIAKKFPNLWKELDVQICEANRSPQCKKTFSKKPYIKKQWQVKNLKGAGEKSMINWKETPIKCQHISQQKLYRTGENGMMYWKDKNCQLRR